MQFTYLGEDENVKFAADVSTFCIILQEMYVHVCVCILCACVCACVYLLCMCNRIMLVYVYTNVCDMEP